MLLAMMAAFVLLAESMVAIAFARNWHLSWWEWHVLMLVAFGLVALGARHSWREERFADLYLSDTVAGDRDIERAVRRPAGLHDVLRGPPTRGGHGMLNAYFAVAVPAVVGPYGGDVDRIIGDALMVTFNKRGDQPDHASRAAGGRAGAAGRDAAVADAHPGWPRFRVGINSGPVTVSLLGTGGGRTHTVIGDTVNTASRIEGKAPAGGVAMGPGTKARMPGAAPRRSAPSTLKGKAEPVEAYLLLGLRTV